MAPPGQPKKPDISAAAKERNEYIPSFIAKKPFYVPEDDNTDYLEHQRLQSTAQDSKWYDRGRKTGPAATKFRKGACENCGAMTHKTKECLHRKRKLGARWTGRDIQADEVVQDVKLGWDAKRDRWNGYDAQEYENVIQEYNELEQLKKETQGTNGDVNAPEDEGTKYEEEADMGRQQATSTRNLRIREDTAKYLLNLDLESAKYDPKTRSMVDAGASGSGLDNALVAEEGFMRASGDAAEFEQAQKYAWETQQRGDKDKLHLQANPTEGALQRKKQVEEAEEKREKHRKGLLDKYGDQSAVQKIPIQGQIEESERFVEYDEGGGVKGAIKAQARSKYAEDVLVNNHTSVWGSWWSNFQWGYACCHSLVKNSYCTGEEGRKAFEEAEDRRTGKEEHEIARQISLRGEDRDETTVSKPTAQDLVSHNKTDATRKRVYDEMRDGITEEEMEEYRKKRSAANDPMAAMLGQDQLVK